ncbi:MAG: hypothetical protein CTR53_07740 [Ferrovibrio sp.]|nr:MAG: hypothetical protein CTR53_07740 [Ferrovibrio sp.]
MRIKRKSASCDDIWTAKTQMQLYLLKRKFLFYGQYRTLPGWKSDRKLRQQVGAPMRIQRICFLRAQLSSKSALFLNIAFLAERLWPIEEKAYLCG